MGTIMIHRWKAVGRYAQRAQIPGRLLYFWKIVVGKYMDNAPRFQAVCFTFLQDCGLVNMDNTFRSLTECCIAESGPSVILNTHLLLLSGPFMKSCSHCLNETYLYLYLSYKRELSSLHPFIYKPWIHTTWRVRRQAPKADTLTVRV